MSQQSVLRRHRVTCLAFILGVAVGITSLALCNQIDHGRHVVMRNPIDHALAAKIQGSWKLKDLRVAEDHGTPIKFMSTGVMKHDPIYDERWFCNDGLLYFSYTRIDGVPNDGKDHLFSVIPTFDESTDTMTIAFPGQEPHAVLTRVRS